MNELSGKKVEGESDSARPGRRNITAVTSAYGPDRGTEPNFEKCGNGLIPAVAQDADTGEILMLAYMNHESFQKTLETGEVHYYSRSRRELWHKGGGSSGRVQKVVSLYLDCDCDAVVIKIKQVGGISCHTGRRTCFHYELDPETKSFRLVD